MRNIELKARCADLDVARRVCEAILAEPQGDLHQIDTYFGVEKGRLKLRECAPGADHLVFYRRQDDLHAKACDYLITPAHPGLKDLLAEAFGVIGVVTKSRALWLWKNVRIHLDSVKDLGSFIEFEAVLSGDLDDADGSRKVAWLSGEFGIHESDLLPCSYIDLLPIQPPAAKRGERPAAL